MSNDQHGLTPDDTCNGSIHLLLVLRIDKGCCLIQHDDRRILQKNPGKSNALPLSAGELTSSKPCRGIVSFRLDGQENELNFDKVMSIMKEVKGTIPAETAVVLKGTPGTYLYKVGGEAAAIEVNDLKGTLEPIEAAGKYVLAKPESEEVGFYPATEGTIAANKAYLEVASGVKGFVFKFGDDATGIEETTLSNSPLKGENIYNLAGQRISKMQKGINIVNGKKILK